MSKMKLVAAREQMLLDRIRQPEEARRSIQEDTNRLEQSVLANLRRVLNSRQGCARIAPDYGIPDMCSLVHEFPDAIAIMRDAVKSAIAKFEPRLRRVRVEHAPHPDDPLGLHFEIKADLVTRERASILIETRIDSLGSAQVKG